MTAPRYRIEREASEAQAWQELVNLLRRLVGLRIRRTGQQAHDDYLKQFGENSTTEKAVR